MIIQLAAHTFRALRCAAQIDALRQPFAGVRFVIYKREHVGRWPGDLNFFDDLDHLYLRRRGKPRLYTASLLAARVQRNDNAETVMRRKKLAKQSKSKVPARPRAAPSADQRTAAEARTDGSLGKIIRLLTDNATVVISGTRMAADLGITRTAVWRAVQQLRACGAQIAGRPATGYQLAEIPDLLLPEVLEPLLRGVQLVTGIRHYFKIGSTNVAAMQAAAAGERAGTVFVAEEQTAGRGRAGHGWQSEASAGIYCSIILRPAAAPADVLFLSLAAGLAVAEAIGEVTGATCDLRWPNDVLLNEKKVCGVLAEMNAEATRVRYVVLGIGLNVNQQRFSGELAETASSLRMELGRKWSRIELLAALLKSLDREYRRFLESGPADLARRFEAASTLARGAQVRVEEAAGFCGITDGLDERGFLLVRTEGGVRRVLSGAVRKL